MSGIPNTTYQQRLNTLRHLLQSKGLDALIIYNAEREDPSFLPWILGNYIIDTTYLIITKQDAVLAVPQWRLEEAQELYTAIPLRFIGTPEKTSMLQFITQHLLGIKHAGYAGNLPLKDVEGMEITWKNTEPMLAEKYLIKDKAELAIMRRARNLTVNFLDKIIWSDWIGKSEITIARWIRSEMEKRGLPIAHLCLTTGERTHKTTCGTPSSNLLTTNDTICVDFGIGIHTYYSDITRCYFIGANKVKYEPAYQKLLTIVKQSAANIRGGMPAKNVLPIIKQEFNNAQMAQSFIPTDLGHGIGTGNHEQPEIGFGEQLLEPGMVFTLEPEAKLPDGTLLRYEDMFFINSLGTCRVLT